MPEFRHELLLIQQELLEDANFPVILLFAGVDGAGKGQIVNLLNEWMDPRWLVTHAYGSPSQDEAERPEYWRYWRDLPPKGQIGMFLSSWYSQPILDYVYEKQRLAEFDERLDRIMRLEKGLVDNGALIIKFWLHLDKESQQKHFEDLEQDPLNAWRVTEDDWKHWRMYQGFMDAAEHTISKTSTGEAPWHIIEGVDIRYSSTAVANRVRDNIRSHMQILKNSAAFEAASKPKPSVLDRRKSDKKNKKEPSDKDPGREVVRPDVPTVLSTLDDSLTLSKTQYRQQLSVLQGDINQLQRLASKRKISTLLVFEGPDSAGKGGAIRRITGAFDAKQYKVIPIAAPTDEERSQHYLWRFWRHIPKAGRIIIYDRSWYGRVLVERVEGFAAETAWRRAYREINDFEEQLIESDIVVIKFWLHITPEEQLARFDARAVTPYKKWKLTDEDWRNREKWADYELAVNDMVERTSTALAPWTLVEGNDKRFARIKVLTTIRDRLKEKLEHDSNKNVPITTGH